jgi:flagellar basal-body rod protein FlgB
MTDLLFSDPSYQVAKLALQGLAQRNEVIAQNIANVDTPGYRALEADFESTLRRAMQKDGNLPLKNTRENHMQGSETDFTRFIQISQKSGGTLRADGNNVDIDQELASQTETGLRYQAISQVVSKKLNLLKSISQGN